MNSKLKKIVTVILALVMVFSLAACGNGGSDDGADGGAKASPISVISREDGSGTRSAFTELMGILVDDVDHTTVNAEISQSTSVVVTTVAGNPKAIGYISMGAMSDAVKAMKVDGVEATTEFINIVHHMVNLAASLPADEIRELQARDGNPPHIYKILREYVLKEI